MYAVQPDPYVYRGTTILRNRAGLTDQAELEQFEQVMFLTRADEPLPAGRFSGHHLRRLRRHLFGDVYSWAGRFRTVRLSKGTSTFCYPENIAGELARLAADVQRKRFLRNRPPDQFAVEAAEILTRLNAIHPFREGNGRTQLAFPQQLAVHAGHPLDLGRLNSEAYLAAVIESFFGDEAALARQLRRMTG